MSSYDELSARLRNLRTWAGVSYREAHRRVVRLRRERGIAELPAYDTVHRCLQPGRRRVDAELVVDVARVLLGDDVRTAEWRQACQAVEGRAGEAAVVGVATGLPDDLAGFTGRAVGLSRLIAAAEARSGAGMATVVAVFGMAGVGKTTFAVHAAHRLVEQGWYGDLQLFVDLRGHDPERAPADPAAVLDGFLRTLGARGGTIHRMDLSARSASFAELLAGKSALVLLDNAASEDQVLPLLPVAGCCLVLVTSRRRLDLPGAVQLGLDPFTRLEASELLRSAGHEADADPATVDGIADLCGRLPLAVALVSSRIVARPDWTMADHLDRLSELRNSRRLEDGVAIALGSSYDQLAADHQRLLRLLALHPGRDFDPCAAAALCAAPLPDTVSMLGELLEASMLRQRVAGRYEFHDLLRIFAADRAIQDEAAGARRSALTRLLDHYRHAAMVAMDHYAPQDRDRRPRFADPGTPVPRIDDRDAAAGWLDAERTNLIALAGCRSPGHTGDLSVLLFHYLDSRAHHEDAAILHDLAAEVAEGPVRGRALMNRGIVAWRLGRNDEALRYYQQALSVHRELGNRAGEGSVQGNIGVTCAQLGRYDEAIDHLSQAIVIHEADGNHMGAAAAHGNLGFVYEQVGRYDDALTENRHNLRLARELDYRAGEGVALGNIGGVYRRLGRHRDALEHHQQALQIARERGYRTYQAEALNDVALDLRGLGRTAEALDRHREALAIAENLGNRSEQARAHTGLADCLQALGDATSARSHRQRVAALGDDPPSHPR